MRENKKSSIQNYVDPICGMTVKPETAAGKYEHDGETFYFCATGCLEKFKARVAVEEKHSGHSLTVRHGEMKAAPEGEFVDPVCGMSVSPETSAGKYEFQGQTYYFCSTGCLNKFRQNPQSFLAEKKEEKKTAEAEGIEYTCPMHPEIVQIGPGTCPKCGMALEPKTYFARRRARSRISRYETAVLDFRRVDDSGFCSRNGGNAAEFSSIDFTDGLDLGAIYFDNAGCSLGRFSVFCARRSICKKCQPEYVHADCYRNRRGLFVQCGDFVFARSFSRFDARRAY